MALSVFILAFFIMPLAFADSGVYSLETHERVFDIEYDFDGTILAMDVDTQTTSLLIGTSDVEDSIFSVSFPSEVLAATDADFIILVDGLETDYLITYDGDNPNISFPVPALTEEIEIIGTSVIPEFPLGALAIMGVMSSAIVIFARRNRLFR